MLLAQNMRDMHPAIAEDELAVVIAAMGDAVIAGQNLESRHALVDEKRGNLLLGPASGLLDAAGGEQDHVICNIGMADKMLAAVDYVVFAVAFSARGHRAQIRSRARLGHGQALDPLAPDGRLQIALDLLASARAQNVAGPRHRPMQRIAGSAQFPFQ